MIRVFRAAPGQTFAEAARTNEPCVIATSLDDLNRLSALPASGLSEREQHAVLTASLKLVAREGKIVVSTGGDLFLVERELAPSTPAPKVEPASSGTPACWIPSERGARVLVVHLHPEAGERLAQVLSFLGYDARSFSGGAQTASSTALQKAVRASGAALVILDGSLLARTGAGLVASCRAAGPIGIALLSNGEVPHDPRAPARDGAVIEVTLTLPIRAESLAAALDPVIASVRASRADAS